MQRVIWPRHLPIHWLPKFKKCVKHLLILLDLRTVSDKEGQTLQREGNVTVEWIQDLLTALVDIHIYESSLC